MQVDCNLLLRATPQVQCTLHPYPQGRRGAGRPRPSSPSYATNTTCAPSLSARTMRHRSTATFFFELRRKYNVRSILVRKDDEAQVDYNLLLRATPQIQRAPHPCRQRRQSAVRLKSPFQGCISNTKVIPNREQIPKAIASILKSSSDKP